MKSFLGYMADEPKRVTIKRTSEEAVRDELERRPGAYLTSRDLVTMTGLTYGRVNDAIYALTQSGNIERLRVDTNGPDEQRRRQSGQAYRWKPNRIRG